MTKPTTTRLLVWSVAALVLLALAGGAVALVSHSFARAQAAPKLAARVDPASLPPALVKTAKPAREHLKRTTTQPATVEPYEKTDLYAKVSGYLHTFGQVPGPDGKPRDLDFGDRVGANQVLAELWIPELEQDRVQKEALVEKANAEVVQAEAMTKAAQAAVGAMKAKQEEAQALLVRAEAELVYRRGEYERYLKLLNDRTATKEQAAEKFNQYKVAETGVAAAKAAIVTAEANTKAEEAKAAVAEAEERSAAARLKVAKVNLEQAKIMVAYGEIRAPYPGIVVQRRFDTGAFVAAAGSGKTEPLFTLVRSDRVRILTDIPEADAALVKVGQPAVLRVDALRGRSFAAKVVRFADTLDPATRTMRTQLELDEPAAELRTGMFGTVAVTLVDHPMALLLPASALLLGESKPAVMVVQDGKARKRVIEVGSNDGVRVHVTAGLTGDEDVILDGKGTAQDGQAVEVAR
jgi:HlyD family secretion protein